MPARPSSAALSDAFSMRNASGLLSSILRHHLVDQPHLEGFLGVVLVAQEPDLARLLLADHARQQPRPVAAVEGPDLGARLAEPGVVGSHREVTDDVEDVAAA